MKKDAGKIMTTPNGTTPLNGRIAFLDFLFCWPPKGGADVDVYSVMTGLHRRGCQVKLFVPAFAGCPGRGEVEADALSFPVEIVPVPRKRQQLPALAEQLQKALDGWRPDIVIVCHGYLLKTALIPMLKAKTLISRIYANEIFCLKDAFHYKDGAPCPLYLHKEPELCRKCAAEHLETQVKKGLWDPWTHEYIITRGWDSSFGTAHRNALDRLDSIIVYNEGIKGALSPWDNKVTVIPGGITAEPVVSASAHSEKQGQGMRVLMAGRVEDPLKGLAVLEEACCALRRKGYAFEVQVTHYDPFFGRPELKATGWLSHGETLALYRNAHIAVVPSLWEEAFGLVAVEAMAAGVPVCASRTGGLQEIIEEGKTGFLFKPGDSAALADVLEKLLQDPELRKRMGDAAQQRALEEYAWDKVIEKHYIPLLKGFLP